MKLHFKTIGTGKPLIILHGIFGSSDNWQTLGKDFAKYANVYLVDLRNHGKSPHSDEFNYKTMVEDIVELLDDEGLEKVNLLGHSMGGKVAMYLAALHPEKIERLVVVDIAPKYYPPHHQQIFDGFHSVNLTTLKSRKDADEQMTAAIPNFAVRQFILKNLYRDTKGNFKWKLNIEAIEKGVKEVGTSLKADVSFEGHSLFIAGSKSDYIVDDDYQMIQSLFPHAEIITINGAGHWVHAEKPDELRESVLNFLNAQG
ncbi:MAG: alpha/beta fold hydrolase [Ekhidna sp.]|nr:alpha/beta fold hydrolase [Ekhidna sp.]